MAKCIVNSDSVLYILTRRNFERLIQFAPEFCNKMYEQAKIKRKHLIRKMTMIDKRVRQGLIENNTTYDNNNSHLASYFGIYSSETSSDSKPRRML